MYSMENRIVKRKRKRPARRIGLIAAASAAAVLLVLCAVNSAVRGPVISAAKERAEEMVRRALNGAVANVLESASVPALETRENGAALIITADAAGLDLIAASIAGEAQEAISRMVRDGAAVDLGTALGFVPLSGRGPRLDIGFAPMGHAEAEVRPSLRSAGINQSLFTVELRLSASVRIFVAGTEEEIAAESAFPLCQTVIVGSVPQVYTNVANEEDMLNLIPTDLP